MCGRGGWKGLELSMLSSFGSVVFQILSLSTVAAVSSWRECLDISAQSYLVPVSLMLGMQYSWFSKTTYSTSVRGIMIS